MSEKSRVYVHIPSEDVFYQKLDHMNYLVQKHNVLVGCAFLPTVQQIFPSVEDAGQKKCIGLGSFHLKDPQQYRLPPLRYIGMGLLGDFIHQLSVVNEMFRKTGRKGVLYLTDLGSFRHGREKAYMDTFVLLSNQSYIEEYKLHTGEEYDIDLTSWIHSGLLFRVNWNHLYKDMFGVEWGATPWLVVHKKDKRWRETVFFHVSTRRPIDPRIVPEGAVFLSQDEAEYNDFVGRFGRIAPYYKPSSFMEMVVAIVSCKEFIGSLSTPLAIAYASFTPCKSQDMRTIDSTHFRGMHVLWPHFQYVSN